MERTGRRSVSAVWQPDGFFLSRARPKRASRAVPAPSPSRGRAGATIRSISTGTARCTGWPRPALPASPNRDRSTPRAISPTRRSSRSCERTGPANKERGARGQKKRPPLAASRLRGGCPCGRAPANGRRPRRLGGRSVENVNRPGRLARTGRVAAAGAGALAENPCIAAGLGLKLPPRLGCRPARGICPASPRTAEIRPTEPGRACPVKGVRH